MQHQHIHFQSPIKITKILNSTNITNQTNQTNSNNHQKVGNKLQRQISVILQLKKNGNITEALSKINNLLSINPNNARCYQIKGEIAFGLKHYSQSLFCYDQLLFIQGSIENFPSALTPQTGSQKVISLYHYNRGLCLSKLNRHNEAITAFLSSIALNKQKVDTFLSLAYSYGQIGHPNKAIDIFHKLSQNGNSSLLNKMVDMVVHMQGYSAAVQFIQQVLAGKQILKEVSILTNLQMKKADCYCKLQNYDKAVQTYRQVIKQQHNEEETIKIYFKMAICLDKAMRIDQSIQTYTQILALNTQNIDVFNNLANLQLRQQDYSSALLTLNQGINLCMHKNIGATKLLLLRAHRIVALTKLQRRCQAMVDVKHILNALQNGQNNQGSQQNYKFIKDVVEKYEYPLSKLCQMQRQTKCEVANHFSLAIKNLSQQIIESISCDLEHKQNAQDQLELLSQRINRLHNQIMQFKSTTIKQQQKSQLRVHTKIQQIEQMLSQKQQQASKLASQMLQLKQEYSDIYDIINQMRLEGPNSSNLAKAIKQLKQQGKQAKALYAQQLYWIFNAYLVSIRLVANHLLPQGRNLVHLKGISSFFARFKGIFEVASHIPSIGTVCAIINSLLSLYLNQQSNYVYRILNKAVTKSFTNEQELQRGIESAIVDLLKTDYIDKVLQKSKNDKIRNEMKAYNRAYEWFSKQKQKVIAKVMQFKGEQSLTDKLVKQRVVQDIGTVLLFIVRSQENNSIRHYESDLFKVAFSTALLTDFKTTQITGLYERSKQKQLETRQGCSSKCEIC